MTYSCIELSFHHGLSFMVSAGPDLVMISLVFASARPLRARQHHEGSPLANTQPLCTCNTLVHPHVYSSNKTSHWPCVHKQMWQIEMCAQQTSTLSFSSSSVRLSASLPEWSSEKPAHTLVQASVHLQDEAESNLGEKRAEVFKVSRRSDHLYESCAVKPPSPWELLLPT